MTVDHENAHAAWDWAVERGDVGRLDQAVYGLCHYHARRWRYQEGEAACRAAAEKLTAIVAGDRPVAPQSDIEGPVLSDVEGPRLTSQAAGRVLARILTWQVALSPTMGDLEPSRQLLRQSLALLDAAELAGQDTRTERAFTLSVMGGKARASGDLEEYRRLAEQSLALYRALGDPVEASRVLIGLSWRAITAGNYSEAQQFAKESLALMAPGDQWGAVQALTALGWIARAQGQLDEAERLLREVITVQREIGQRSPQLVVGLLGLGRTLNLRGEFSEAHASCQEALALREDAGHRGLELAWVLAELSAAKLHQGQYEAARTQAQKNLSLAREVGRQLEIGQALRLLGSLALAEEAYAEARGRYQESLALFRESGERGELSWSLAEAAYAARGLGDLRQARADLNEALRTASEIGNFAPLLHALPGLALLLADQVEVERAVELYALASRYPFVANSRWFEDVAGKQIAAVAATLPPEVVAAAQERGRARDLWDTAAELVEEGKEHRFTESTD
jgi:tetratricopeptide (TPR) repeat protein